METGVRILHREENVAPVRSAESKQRPQAEALTSQRICFIPTILHSCISVTCAAISGFLWTFFFAVRIQHSLICQTVLSYSSANPSRVPYECFKVSKPHCQLLNSARCLQSLWRQPSRGNAIARACTVHQQLSCFPHGHNRKSWSIWGQTVYHSQQGHCTKQHKFVASCCKNSPFSS